MTAWGGSHNHEAVITVLAVSSAYQNTPQAWFPILGLVTAALASTLLSGVVELDPQQ